MSKDHREASAKRSVIAAIVRPSSRGQRRPRPPRSRRGVLGRLARRRHRRREQRLAGAPAQRSRSPLAASTSPSAPRIAPPRMSADISPSSASARSRGLGGGAWRVSASRAGHLVENTRRCPWPGSPGSSSSAICAIAAAPARARRLHRLRDHRRRRRPGRRGEPAARALSRRSAGAGSAPERRVVREGSRHAARSRARRGSGPRRSGTRRRSRRGLGGRARAPARGWCRSGTGAWRSM